ncbi:pyridoxamine 5'-phosphate oxidase family protein [Novosphingobium sp.]|uniref:pyridoxamine 5'-phosphate oxidase family protein n=1 Tax=Novosphingobium sp. TaxID=1874826 RepID=UPI00333EA5EF
MDDNHLRPDAAPAHLLAVLNDARRRLDHAARDRHAAMHAPVVVTGDGDARIMVLRGVDDDGGVLRFHTDQRSPKVAQIDADARLTVLAYEPQDRVQLRLTGAARVDRDGTMANAAWAAASPLARRVYLVESAPGAVLAQPGSTLPAALQTRRPTLAESEAGRDNFAVIVMRIEVIDWLQLGHEGGRRARFVRDAQGDGWQGEWIAP